MAPGCHACGKAVPPGQTRCAGKLACAKPEPITYEHMKKCIERFEHLSDAIERAGPPGSERNPLIVSPLEFARRIREGTARPVMFYPPKHGRSAYKPR